MVKLMIPGMGMRDAVSTHTTWQVMMLSRIEIRRFLNDNVELARAEYQSAHTEFRAAIAALPASLPPPDGNGRVRLARESYRVAMRVYSEALREYNEFNMDGRIPDRFQRDQKAAGA